MIWSDRAVGRSFWLQSRDWIGGCFGLQGVPGGMCEGPGEKHGVWNPKVTTGVEKGGRGIRQWGHDPPDPGGHVVRRACGHRDQNGS